MQHNIESWPLTCAEFCYFDRWTDYQKLFFLRFSLGVLNELDAMADFASLAGNAATLTVANIWPKTQTNHLL